MLKVMGALVGMFVLAASAAAGLAVSAPPMAVAAATEVDEMLPRGYSNPRSAERAVQWALGQVGVTRDNGYCLRFVNLAFGRPSGPPSAHLVWGHAPPRLRHRSGPPPRGALVVWSSAIGGGHGHIGVSLGNGRMVSTTSGPVSVLKIRTYSPGAYLGWLPPYFYM